MHVAELQHRLMEAQGRIVSQVRIKPYVAAARCQQQHLSKIGVTEPDFDDDEEEVFEQCVIEEREKGRSKSRARRICEDFVTEERRASLLSGNVNTARRKYLKAGILSSHESVGRPGVFTIYQK